MGELMKNIYRTSTILAISGIAYILGTGYDVGDPFSRLMIVVAWCFFIIGAGITIVAKPPKRKKP